jgi:alpha-D-xyloside xylohydrolase
VTEFERRSRKVYLPLGSDWFDALTGVKLTGGQDVLADAPRERMPLYVRAGAIIPAGPDVQWTGEDPQGPLTLHVFAGADGSFTLYEDEGTDMGYTRGAFVRVPLSWNDADRTLSIGAREGSFPGMAQSRSLTVVLHEGRGQGEVFDRRDGRSVTYSGEAVTLRF